MSRWKIRTHCKTCNAELTVMNSLYNGVHRYSHCKTCNRIRVNKRAEANPDGYRRIHLKNTFGITLEEYEILLKLQDGKCAICGGTDLRNLAVDHNHKTNQIRGLLCMKCNVTIGNINEDLDHLEKIRNYLMKYMDLPKVEHE